VSDAFDLAFDLAFDIAFGNFNPIFRPHGMLFSGAGIVGQSLP